MGIPIPQQPSEPDLHSDLCPKLVHFHTCLGHIPSKALRAAAQTGSCSPLSSIRALDLPPLPCCNHCFHSPKPQLSAPRLAHQATGGTCHC